MVLELKGYDAVVNPNLHLPLPRAVQGSPDATINETLDVMVKLLLGDGGRFAGDDEVHVGEVVRIHVRKTARAFGSGGTAT